ncbi:hypothetical protein [Mangrovibacterium sp.]|uniref:hypothetical protein n=1 Tax=Mangrovibacterium sp. TaxID=1961364 RepID=UPI0035669FF8
MKQLFKRSLGIAITFIALFASSSAFAQPQGGGGGGGGQQGPPSAPTAKEITKMVEEVSKELSLTEEQKTKVSALYTDHFKVVKAKLEAGRPERSEMEALEKSFETNVNKVLTPAQQKLYAAYLKKNKQNRGGGQRPS